MPTLLTADELTRLIHTGVPGSVDMGLTVERVDDARVYCRAAFNPQQLRPGGTLSGPTLMALADTAMYAAVLARIGPVEMALTQSFTINFIARPPPGDLLAVGEALKIGKRAAALDVKLYAAENNLLVAHATGFYSLPPPADRPARTKH